MYVKRERYLARIRPFYDTDLIKVLTGVRRSGKSVLLEQIEEEFRSSGFDEKHIIRVNFEDLRYKDLRTSERLHAYIEGMRHDSGRFLIFLDEIQHVRNFEEALSSLRISGDCSIFVTGSNSKLLSGKLATLLVGRCIEFRIMPFSFAESLAYCRLLGKNQSDDELFHDYLNWGGFPLRFTLTREADVRKYLEQTYQGILNRDIMTEGSRILRQSFERIAGYMSPV